MENLATRPHILTLSDGKAGHYRQTDGILAALPECDSEIIRIEYPSKRSDNWLRAKVAVGRGLIPKRLAWHMLESALTESCLKALRAARRPDVVLSAASTLAGPNLLLSKIYDAKSVVCLRPSPIGVGPFDMAILPRHHWHCGVESTVRILGLPTPINPELVRQRRAQLEQDAAAQGVEIPPTIGLLFGGDDKHYRWTEPMAQKVMDGFIAAARIANCKIAVATSRRTPPDVEALIRARVLENPLSYYTALASDPTPKDAPVLTILALSRWVAVTIDSLMMVSETVSGGAPVGLIEIPCRGHNRYAPTFAALEEQTGMVRMTLDTVHEVSVRLSQQPPVAEPLRDAETAANGIRRLLGLPLS
jgi:hypothetical protein